MSTTCINSQKTKSQKVTCGTTQCYMEVTMYIESKNIDEKFEAVVHEATWIE